MPSSLVRAHAAASAKSEPFGKSIWFRSKVLKHAESISLVNLVLVEE